MSVKQRPLYDKPRRLQMTKDMHARGMSDESIAGVLRVDAKTVGRYRSQLKLPAHSKKDAANDVDGLTAEEQEVLSADWTPASDIDAETLAAEGDLLVGELTRVASYPKILDINHEKLAEAREDPTVTWRVEEKVDGSQFSWATDRKGNLKARSKGKQQMLDSPDDMFRAAIASVQSLTLPPNLIFRAEYLKSPRHNTLRYDRVPDGGLMLFDVQDRVTGRWFNHDEVVEMANQIGVSHSVLLSNGKIPTKTQLETWISEPGLLGGANREGVVLKPTPPVYDERGQRLMGKWVSAEFVEVNAKNWKTNIRAPQKDKINSIIDRFKTEARWGKAVQHLRENGELTNTPADIGRLIDEARRDLMEEEQDTIKDALWQAFNQQIVRSTTAGLPEWYKQHLEEHSSL